MNDLTPEERAELFTKAREISERTGLGVEFCMVQLQQAKAAEEAWEQAMEAMKALLAPLVDVFLERIDAIISLFEDLSDQIGAILEQPHCPSHGERLRGGRCSRCERAIYCRERGFR